MHRAIPLALLAVLVLCWASTAAAAPQPEWNESLREHFKYVIKVDGKIVAAAKTAKGFKGLTEDSSGVSIQFDGVIVFSKSFQNFLTGGAGGNPGLINMIVGSEKQGEILKVTLGDCRISDVTSTSLVADVEHPATLKFTFTVSPNYVKIS